MCTIIKHVIYEWHAEARWGGGGGGAGGVDSLGMLRHGGAWARGDTIHLHKSTY